MPDPILHQVDTCGGDPSGSVAACPEPANGSGPPVGPPSARAGGLSMLHILRTWWPLAASWLLMGFEGPAVASVVARLADPKINLAAWGGVVFPLSLMAEAPVIMMLAASTALCRDCLLYTSDAADE